jgi:hypothetical protein
VPDRHCCRGRKPKRFQRLRIYFDVFVFGIFETFDKVRLFNFTCLVDILMMNPFVRLSVDLVKLNVLAGIDGRVDLDLNRNE